MNKFPYFITSKSFSKIGFFVGFSNALCSFSNKPQGVRD